MGQDGTAQGEAVMLGVKCSSETTSTMSVLDEPEKQNAPARQGDAMRAGKRLCP